MATLSDNALKRIYEYLFSTSTLIGTFLRPTVSITEMNSGVHKGVGYSISGYDPALPNASSVIFFGMTNTKNVHFLGLDVTASAGGWLIELYEAPTVTTNGMLQSPTNMNFQSTNVNGMTVYSGGTVSVNGVLKLSKHIHALGTGSANRVDTEGSIKAGMILKRNTTYMFKITNNSGSTNAYEVHLQWLEI